MLAIRKILHPTDFSAGAAMAFDHAFHMARHFDAEIHLLHVAPTFGDDPIHNAFEASIDDDNFLAKIWADAEKQLKDLAGAYADPNLRLRRVLTRGAATGPVILKYAETEKIDLIVMGTHGRRGIKHLLLGSVTEEVVHRASCHVLTVRQREGPGDEARPIQRILVPVDFTEQAVPLLQVAREIAGGYGAQLDLLHVIKPLPFSVSLMTPISIQELAPGINEQVRDRLADLFEETSGPDVPIKIHVAEGQPVQAILDVAGSRPTDLILIAPSNMTGIERFFLGSVAERVVRAAFCPVFVAKAEVLASLAAPTEAMAASQRS